MYEYANNPKAAVNVCVWTVHMVVNSFDQNCEIFGGLSLYHLLKLKNKIKNWSTGYAIERGLSSQRGLTRLGGFKTWVQPRPYLALGLGAYPLRRMLCSA